MVIRTLRIVLGLVLVLAASRGHAQQAAGTQAGVRVFLDCNVCDSDYLRTQTPWVDFVRDRTVSDVHVLVTRMGTGAGGNEYTINFIGLGAFRARVDTLGFVSQPNQANDLVRQGLTRTIQLGLMPFVARTPQAHALRFSFDDAAGAAAAAAPAVDRWNAWVLSVGANGYMEREQRQDDMNVNGSFSARRITPLWKAGFSANGNVSRSRFKLEEEGVERQVTNTRENYNGGAVMVRSLGPHWGTGMQASVSSSTFQNTRLAIRTAPAVEYSLWPYEEATRRQLTVQYSVGISSFKYQEETIFSRFAETRPSQAFVVGYDAQQRWGSANAELETASFLDDFSQYRVEGDAGVSLRLFKGFALDIGGNASLVRDQIAIIKRDATPEEVLLQRRALGTDYRYSGHLGIRYTFGSIFNSVVNPRFGTGPGQILR